MTWPTAGPGRDPIVRIPDAVEAVNGVAHVEPGLENLHRLLALAGLACVLLAHPLAVHAQQGSQVAFGAGNYDNSLPVEVNADRLDADSSSTPVESKYVGPGCDSQKRAEP